MACPEGHRAMRPPHLAPFTLSLLAGLSALPPAASAHLALIRQGAESSAALEAGDRTGAALAVGNFNGDAYDDLAMGAPGETLLGLAGAGNVIVVYGSRFGLTHVGAAYHTAAFLGGEYQAGASFGAALASADFNDDGYDDLAIGAPFESVSGVSEAGRVYVLHGGPGGLAATADTIFSQAAGGGGIESGDEFGAALETGDFNGDGYFDLAVGAPGEDADAGVVFQFPGSANGITRVGAGFFKQADLGGTNASGNRFGHALAAGNLFGDANEDLAASAPFRDVLPATLAGVVYLLPGSGTGLTSVGSVSYDAGDLDAAQSSGRFGWALATGQFGAGAYRALAIGEPGRDVSGKSTAGRVIAVHGGAAGLDWSAGGRRVLTQESVGGDAGSLDRFGWSLAAGDRWSDAADDWGVDGYDELAVGAAHEDTLGGSSEAGTVRVLHSTAAHLTSLGVETYTQTELGDDPESVDHLGWSVAFGRFDDTGFANLAVGAPDENTSNDLKYEADGSDIEEFPDAGCVYVNAPWRQVLGLQSRGTVVYNCLFELVYSQRPFDRVRPASTTKIMTVFLASERMDSGHPDHVDSATVYEVPFWVQEVQGSTADIRFCERMRLMDLARACMSVSGNDAAYAIANLLEPEPDPEDVSVFVSKMNQRASELGMTGTRFSNPAGRDAPEDDAVPAALRDNYTTPVDMAILAREAMFNDVFRGIVGTEVWDITRDVPDEIALDCDDPFARASFPWPYTNSFLQGLRAWVPEGSGVKPGGTTAALNTRVLSADKDLGRVIVARFGIPFGASKSAEDAALLALAYANCDPFLVLLPGEPAPNPYMRLSGASTASGSRKGGTVAYPGGDSESTAVAVRLESGSGPAALRVAASRSSEVVLLPMETATFSAEPFSEHEGIRLVNPDTLPVSLHVTTSHPLQSLMITLPPGADTVLPPVAGPLAPGFLLTIQNPWTAPVEIGVEENGYAYETAVGSGAPGPGPFSALLAVGGPVQQQSLSLSIDGRDANPGNTVLAVAYAPDPTVVGVGGPSRPLDPRPIALAAAPWPNPFRDRVRLQFDVRRMGSARLAVYDVRGRQVWSRAAERLAAGRWQAEWDGSGSSGPLPPGLYFFRLWFDGEAAASGRLVLLAE